MITVKLSKDNFFDREAVIKAVGRARVKVLSKQGAMVRRTAQLSLVYSDGSAPAGSPPHAHKSRTITRTSKSTGRVRVRSVSFLREFIRFAYDPASENAVIGPERLDSTRFPESLAALEHGGSSTIVDRGKERRVNIAAHPFMGPALAAEAPKFAAMWADSVR